MTVLNLWRLRPNTWSSPFLFSLPSFTFHASLSLLQNANTTFLLFIKSSPLLFYIDGVYDLVHRRVDSYVPAPSSFSFPSFVFHALPSPPLNANTAFVFFMQISALPFWVHDAALPISSCVPYFIVYPSGLLFSDSWLSHLLFPNATKKINQVPIVFFFRPHCRRRVKLPSGS